MSAPNTSSSSSQLVSYAQDVDYTRTEGFKQFKARYNVKNARVARNNPNGAYPSAKTVFQAVKGPRLYYPNDYLGSLGVHLLAPVRYWLENLLGFIG